MRKDEVAPSDIGRWAIGRRGNEFERFRIRSVTEHRVGVEGGGRSYAKFDLVLVGDEEPVKLRFLMLDIAVSKYDKAKRAAYEELERAVATAQRAA